MDLFTVENCSAHLGKSTASCFSWKFSSAYLCVLRGLNPFLKLVHRRGRRGTQRRLHKRLSYGLARSRFPRRRSEIDG